MRQRRLAHVQGDVLQRRGTLRDIRGGVCRGEREREREEREGRESGEREERERKKPFPPPIPRAMALPTNRCAVPLSHYLSSAASIEVL